MSFSALKKTTLLPLLLLQFSWPYLLAKPILRIGNISFEYYKDFFIISYKARYNFIMKGSKHKTTKKTIVLPGSPGSLVPGAPDHSDLESLGQRKQGSSIESLHLEHFKPLDAVVQSGDDTGTEQVSTTLLSTTLSFSDSVQGAPRGIQTVSDLDISRPPPLHSATFWCWRFGHCSSWGGG